MTEYSYFWDGLVTGDATLAPYTSTEYAFVQRILHNADRTAQGPIAGVLNELAVTGTGTANATVATGAAFVGGKLYYSDAAVNLAVTAGATQYVVLRWNDAAQTIRAAILANGVSPTQTAATWEISIARTVTSAGGLITGITDLRNFARSPLGAGYEYAGLATDDIVHTATAWNSLGAGVSITLTPGYWLMWGTAHLEQDPAETAGGRLIRIYNTTSAATVAETGINFPAGALHSASVPIGPLVVTPTATNVYELQFYATAAADIVYGNFSAVHTSIIAIRVPNA